MTGAVVDRALTARVERFLYREARLLDEHDYGAWDALWTDDGVYWLPANGDGGDPETEMSIIYDNRSRIALRVKQLLTGRRYAQEPRSRLRRIISNIEILNGCWQRIDAHLEQSGVRIQSARRNHLGCAQ